MHQVYPILTERLHILFLHIADTTAQPIRKQGIRFVGLIATRFTMEQNFYIHRLKEQHNINIIITDASNREVVHQTIYNELCKGVCVESSRQAITEIAGKLIAKGAEAIVLGCTELGMLVSQQNLQVPIFDSTYLHVQAAPDFALSEDAV